MRLLALFLVLTSTLASAFADERLNILFVFADDWGRYAGCYRGLDGRPGINDVVETPAVDRLAREGVVFRNALCSGRPYCLRNLSHSRCRSTRLTSSGGWLIPSASWLSGLASCAVIAWCMPT